MTGCVDRSLFGKYAVGVRQYEIQVNDRRNGQFITQNVVSEFDQWPENTEERQVASVQFIGDLDGDGINDFNFGEGLIDYGIYYLFLSSEAKEGNALKRVASYRFETGC